MVTNLPELREEKMVAKIRIKEEGAGSQEYSLFTLFIVFTGQVK